MAMQEIIEDAGGHVVGAIGWLDEALDFIGADEADFGVVILDMNLHGAKIYPLADRLIAQGRKFLFITGLRCRCRRSGLSRLSPLRKAVQGSQPGCCVVGVERRPRSILV
jgi:hypothetical protein